MCAVHVLVCMCVTVHTEACKRSQKTSGTLFSKPFAVDFLKRVLSLSLYLSCWQPASTSEPSALVHSTGIAALC